MGLQYAVDVRNAKLNAIVKSIGPSPTMKIWQGDKPSRCNSPDKGTLLASFRLPETWMLPGTDGAITKSGTWRDSSADGTGVPGYFRIYAGGQCKIQGTIGSEMTLGSEMLVQGQIFTVVSFTIRDGNG